MLHFEKPLLTRHWHLGGPQPQKNQTKGKWKYTPKIQHFPAKFWERLIVIVCVSFVFVFVFVWVFPFLPLPPLRQRGRLVGKGGGECGFLIRTQIAQFELYNGAAVSQVTGSLSNSLQKETDCMLKSSTNTPKRKRKKKKERKERKKKQPRLWVRYFQAAVSSDSSLGWNSWEGGLADSGESEDLQRLRRAKCRSGVWFGSSAYFLFHFENVPCFRIWLPPRSSKTYDSLETPARLLRTEALWR